MNSSDKKAMREVEGSANKLNENTNLEWSMLYKNGKPFCRILSNEVIALEPVYTFGSGVPISLTKIRKLILEKEPRVGLGINYSILPPLGGDAIPISITRVTTVNEVFFALVKS